MGWGQRRSKMLEESQDGRFPEARHLVKSPEKTTRNRLLPPNKKEALVRTHSLNIHRMWVNERRALSELIFFYESLRCRDTS